MGGWADEWIDKRMDGQRRLGADEWMSRWTDRLDEWMKMELL